jgi:hypothetical protein
MSKHLMCAAIERLREQKKQKEDLRELERAIEKGCNSTQIFLQIVTQLNAINKKIDALSPEIKSAIYTRHCLNREITFARNTLIDYERYKKCPCMSGSQLQPCAKVPFKGYCKGCEHLQPWSPFLGARWLEGQPASDARWCKRAIDADEHADSTAKKPKDNPIVLSSDEELQDLHPATSVLAPRHSDWCLSSHDSTRVIGPTRLHLLESSGQDLQSLFFPSKSKCHWGEQRAHAKTPAAEKSYRGKGKEQAEEPAQAKTPAAEKSQTGKGKERAEEPAQVKTPAAKKTQTGQRKGQAKKRARKVCQFPLLPCAFEMQCEKCCSCPESAEVLRLAKKRTAKDPNKAEKPALSAEELGQKNKRFDMTVEHILMQVPAWNNVDGFHATIKKHQTYDALDGLGKETYDKRYQSS